MENNPLELNVFNDFLQPHECLYFINQKLSELHPSTVCDNKDGSSVLDSCRTSSGSFFNNPHDPIYSYLISKIAVFTRINSSRFEHVQILRYEPKQEYKPHHDFFQPNQVKQLQRGGQRIRTVLIYLSDVDLGGETYFPHLSLVIKPRMGRMVTWRNTDENINPFDISLHAGLPVLQGVKFVLTCWIREGDYL